MIKKISAFTIIASNYILQASILIESYTKLHPDHNFYLIFIDDKKKNIKNAISINASEIGNITNLNEIRFKYDITEYSTCLKPYVFEYIFKKHASEKIMYIDPDICFYNRINFVIDKLDFYDCVLIPHISKPYSDSYSPTEIEIAKVGHYNLGFAAFKKNKDTIDFLHWWQKKLNKFCYNDPEEYMFTDQKWMDFAPSYLNTYIVREKGYDVAYWNLHEYIGQFSIKKVVFFHFSGYVIDDEYVSKYQDRFKLKNINEYKKFFYEYAERLKELSKNIDYDYKYPYNYFSNGEKISLALRRIYGKMNKETFSSLNVDPFNTKPSNSFYKYLTSRNEKNNMLNIVCDLYDTNKILQKEFPNLAFDSENFEFYEYLSWIVMFGDKEYGISEDLLQIIINDTKHVKFKKIGLISLIEQVKRNYNGSLFIQKIYSVLMRRQPDDLGLTVNLQDIRKNYFYKNRVIYRLMNSIEFKRKNKSSIQLRLYILYLIFITYIYKGIEFFLEFFFSKKTSSQLGINVIGYIDTESGVGESARGVIKALQAIDIPLNIINIEQPWLRRENEEFSSLFTENHQYRINLLCINADQVENIINNQLKVDFFKEKYNIGYWYWESDVFPKNYKMVLKYFDEIWVASEYVKKSIQKISKIPVIVIPPSFSEINVREIGRFDFNKYGININDDDFIFLNIFDSASFWERKNPFSLIKAFKNAFKNKYDIKLVIKTTKIKNSEIYLKLLGEIKKSKNIILLDEYLSKNEINQLEKRTNCYISMHRSEGLGIPLIESILLKKPVIATNFGGNTDFMQNKNSFLIKFHTEKLKEPIGPYPKGTRWAVPDIQDASRLMRYVFEKRIKAQEIAEKGHKEIIEKYDPKKIGKFIRKRLLRFFIN